MKLNKILNVFLVASLAIFCAAFYQRLTHAEPLVAATVSTTQPAVTVKQLPPIPVIRPVAPTDSVKGRSMKRLNELHQQLFHLRYGETIDFESNKARNKDKIADIKQRIVVLEEILLAQGVQQSELPKERVYADLNGNPL